MTANDKIYISADSYLRDIWRLAAAVKASGWRPDVLVALWRGGAPVGVAMHEYFRAAGLGMRACPLACASYTGIRQNGDVSFFCAEGVVGSLRKGERVLVVDDVFDTGNTAVAVRRLLEPTAVDMRMACVYWKPLKNRTTLKPDYFVREADDWLVFPHEIEGLTKEEVAAKDPFLAGLLGADGETKCEE